MAVSHVYTAQGGVLRGDIVTIEADLARGLHSFSIVGLPGKAVEESKDRLSAAIKNSGLTSPKSKNQKITISLAPADLKKDGPLFDLPIAIAYLISSGELQCDIEQTVFIGELSLDGSLRGVRGVLPIIQEAKQKGFTEVIIPVENTKEAALVDDILVTGASSLTEVLQHLDTTREDHIKITPTEPTEIPDTWTETHTQLEDIKGQESAKRGLIIAAAGRHNVLMIGPPGTGKTMLAKTFQGLLPPLSKEEALAVTAIQSIAGEFSREVTSCPPFRAPHHTASHTSLVGGGAHPKPGEITLAHNGVLFIRRVLQKYC